MIAQAEQLLPAIFTIFSQWRLTGAQKMTLLGLSNEKTIHNWKNQPKKAKLTRDLLERASYILGVNKFLQILLPAQAISDQWLATQSTTRCSMAQPRWNGYWPDRWST
jgi:hypothetical protein